MVVAWAAPPELSDDDRTELYLLRRHFGIGAHEARAVLPAWEVALLIDGLVKEGGEDG
jgi:hypothetical protein